MKKVLSSFLVFVLANAITLSLLSVDESADEAIDGKNNVEYIPSDSLNNPVIQNSRSILFNEVLAH